jgi:hypothetical protein
MVNINESQKLEQKLNELTIKVIKKMDDLTAALYKKLEDKNRTTQPEPRNHKSEWRQKWKRVRLNWMATMCTTAWQMLSKSSCLRTKRKRRN